MNHQPNWWSPDFFHQPLVSIVSSIYEYTISKGHQRTPATGASTIHQHYLSQMVRWYFSYRSTLGWDHPRSHHKAYYIFPKTCIPSICHDFILWGSHTPKVLTQKSSQFCHDFLKTNLPRSRVVTSTKPANELWKWLVAFHWCRVQHQPWILVGAAWCGWGWDLEGFSRFMGRIAAMDIELGWNNVKSW